MASTLPAPWIALVAGALFGLGLGCAPSSKGYDPPEAWRAPQGTRSHPFAEVYHSRPGWEADRALGATVDAREYGSPCRLKVTWHAGKARELDFEVRIAVLEHAGFPLPEGMVALDICRDGTDASGRHTQPPWAYLDLEPPASIASFALAPGDVYIPFGGEAVLESFQHAVATVEPAREAGADGPSAVVTLSAPFRSDVTHAHLHAGSAFAWGASRATVVRVVEPAADVVGWVEVALSEQDATEAAETMK